MEKEYKTRIEIHIENEPVKVYKSINPVDDITTNLSRFLLDEHSTHMRYEVGPTQFEALPRADLLKARIKLFALQ